VKRWDIRWVIFPNRSKALIALIARTPGWRLVAQDNVGAVYAKAPELSASGSLPAPS
jgi:hypothetical protein